MLLRILKALRLTFAVIIALYLGLSLGMHSPSWTTSSVLIVSAGTIGETHARWWQRIVGHVIGCWSAFFIVWWLAESPMIIIFTICLFCSTCTYFCLTQFLRKDLWRWVIIGFAIVLSASLSTPDKAFSVMADRLEGVFIGSTTIFLLMALWPIDAHSTNRQRYFSLLDEINSWVDMSKEAVNQRFLPFMQQINAFRMSLSVNYGDYRAIYANELNVVNKIYALEKLGRHIYTLKKHDRYYDNMQEWLGSAFHAVKEKGDLPPLSMQGGDSALAHLLQADFNELRHDSTNTEQMSRLRWQWQNRMFSSGTDSPLISASLMFVASFLSMLAWRHNWPGGGIVLLLTSVFMVTCQYGERMSPKGYVIAFSLGVIYAFPCFIFLLPAMHTALAFWLCITLIYFPLAYLMFGKNPKLAAIGFAVAVMLNANSGSYMPNVNYFAQYITFVLSLVGVALISCATLSLLVIQDPETRLKLQFMNWQREAHRIINGKQVNNAKALARLERRTDVLMNLYTRLDTEAQKIWQGRIETAPLLLTRIQRWGLIRRQVQAAKIQHNMMIPVENDS